ncbi:hypothetical protein [Priestia koreensis]|uniref:Uncharacterized protein n=1 Tax=Priestia koreensis TaxID=284581 RepID=A0A0M0L6C0_9BACI|nr:hypothetical protein [Priestia koreensis]KOO46412.1 hypothetical protein AMD01_11310 [Priestia koreensis]
MTNLFAFKQEFQDELYVIDAIRRGHVELQRQYNKQLLDLMGKVADSAIHVAIAREGICLEEIKEMNFNDAYERMSQRTTSKYSKYNTIVWMKRFLKARKLFSKKLYHGESLLRESLSKLKIYKTSINELPKSQQYYYLKAIEEMRLVIAETINSSYLMEDNNMIATIEWVLFDGLENRPREMITKDDFLSLLNVNHNVAAQKYINNYISDEMNFRDLAKALFLEKIEDDNHSYFSDMFADHFMNVLHDNKDIKDKLHKDLGLNHIPTYSVKFDEFGDVINIKQNTYTLELIAGGLNEGR